MEDFLARLKNLISDKAASMEWLTVFLVLLAIYALGYLCGILPSLFNREKRRREQSAILCEELLTKIFEHEQLYNQYGCEPAPLKKAQIVEQIALVKENLRELECRLAVLEQREPRRLPLRPLPVSQLKIE
jgi:hypothetical protein